jgi:hypothetical protein
MRMVILIYELITQSIIFTHRRRNMHHNEVQAIHDEQTVQFPHYEQKLHYTNTCELIYFFILQQCNLQ